MLTLFDYPNHVCSLYFMLAQTLWDQRKNVKRNYSIIVLTYDTNMLRRRRLQPSCPVNLRLARLLAEWPVAKEKKKESTIANQVDSIFYLIIGLSTGCERKILIQRESCDWPHVFLKFSENRKRRYSGWSRKQSSNNQKKKEWKRHRIVNYRINPSNQIPYR